ncbi:MAG: Isoleucine--tRNA ligase [Alphaproteobacteria bacterium MarineAlpha9_Bin3]|nr:MAG: Isoleucine--tRNA ligase [Alphaproteobacteria bacterium MarineAlpha9_Bin3]|tara:strand:+ start:12481 stop:15273 length:2793 start_codon:yes stop_codon:yes gene_type:complete
MDYKDTVFLPKSSFGMRGGLPQREPEMINRWNKINLWEKLREMSKDKEKFILHDGPPYANGPIHIGTSMNKILKDIINRSKQMSGYNSHYIPGWDCHGLPIEWQVEQTYKKKGINKEEIPIADFRAECRDFADKWIDAQMEDFKRLFVLADWDNRYLTMSFNAEAQIVREIGKFIENGSLYKGSKPVMWSPVEKTALAEAEVEYKDIESTAITVGFKVTTTKEKILQDLYIPIWTTTPWTIPANRAIAYGRNLDYLIIEVKNNNDNDQIFKGQKILIAEERLDKFLTDTNIEDISIVSKIKGNLLNGTVCSHPLYEDGYTFEVPLLEGDFVSTEQGTGFVHVAPGHGEDDFELAQKYGIQVPDIVEDGGTYFHSVPIFAGIHVFKALSPVCEALKKNFSLYSSEKYFHSYPHSWRSKKPIIYRATQQWFISMEKNNLKKIALDSIENTVWVPSISKNRIKSMVKDRPDWCVSRQRVWGVPITVFLNKITGEILRDSEVTERIAKEVEKKGADAWFTEDPQNFLGEKYDANQYECVQDILDVWFDSGSTHSFVLSSNKQKWPADLYLEGSDQHRGWFQSSLLESCGTRGRAPFDAVLTHGFVLDGQGRKMSKSIGNVISPQEIIKQSGSDILRLWVAMTDVTEDVRISPEVLKGVSESYRRLRNTIRFTIGALNDYSESESIDIELMPELERWVLHRIKELDALLKKSVRNYTFQGFYSELHTFCSSDLSAFYFDIRKDSLYCDDFENEKRRSTRTVLYEIFKCLTTWLAPVISYTAEEAWLAHIGTDNEDSIHLKQFPNIPETWLDDKLNQKWINIRKIRRVINGALELARQDKIIGSSLEAEIKLYVKDNEYISLIKEIDIDEIAIVSKSEIIEGVDIIGAYKEDNFKGLEITVSKAKGEKCARCWKIDDNISSVSETSLCERCIKVVE